MSRPKRKTPEHRGHTPAPPRAQFVELVDTPGYQPFPENGFPLAGPVDPPDWTDQALCAQTDPGLFFPEKGEAVRPGKKICAQCPVRVECLDHALSHNERFGIWGGLSERERRKLRGAADAATQAAAIDRLVAA